MRVFIFFSSLLFLLSCDRAQQKQAPYRETALSFLHLRFGYDPTNNWIRQPQNILMLHETFKQVGYKNLISPEEWEQDWNNYVAIYKSPKDLIDSLLWSYPALETAPPYYQEFWQRRHQEKNATTVYKVLQEVQSIMVESAYIEHDICLVNDTLQQLLAFEYPVRPITTRAANDFLEYLLKIGLHYSAYNVIRAECAQFEGIKWQQQKEKVLQQLQFQALEQRPWIEDNTP